MRISRASRVRPVLWLVALVAFLWLLGSSDRDVRADVVPPPGPSEPRTVKDGTFELTFQGRPPVCFAFPAQWQDARACKDLDPRELDPARLPIRAEGTLLARAVMRDHSGDLHVLLLKAPRQDNAVDPEDSGEHVGAIVQRVREAPLLKSENGGWTMKEALAKLHVSSFNSVRVVTTRIRPHFELKRAAELKLEIEYHEILAKDATYLLIVWYPLAVQERGHWESQFLLGNFIAARRELPGEALGYYTGLVALPGSLVMVLIWIFLRQRRLNAQKQRTSAAAGTPPGTR